jgi:hypothetical protein
MNPLNAFIRQNYISLETYRKNGESVRTPVWFVLYRDQICVNTEPDSGKVKRLRCNPSVKVAPCRYDGKVKGTWYSGTARFMENSEIKEVQHLLSKKYGFIRKIFSLLAGSHQHENIYIAITIIQ